MDTNSSTSFSNLILLATLSSSVVNFGYELEDQLTPKHRVDIQYNHPQFISDWKENAFNSSEIYNINSDQDKVNSLITLTNKLLENSRDLDSEFVDIVNENFWDLI